MKILGTLATLAVAQAQTKAAVDPLAIMTCQSVYSNHEGDNDCDALVTLAKCFAIVSFSFLFFSFFLFLSFLFCLPPDNQ